jgi:FAD/FMN-containing dehydrogenase
MDDAMKEKEFEAGFDEDFDRLGEEAVSRHLSSGNFSAGKAEMAHIWLDRRRREAAQAQARAAKRTETRANIKLAILIISAVVAMIAAAAAIIHY